MRRQEEIRRAKRIQRQSGDRKRYTGLKGYTDRVRRQEEIRRAKRLQRQSGDRKRYTGLKGYKDSQETGRYTQG